MQKRRGIILNWGFSHAGRRYQAGTVAAGDDSRMTGALQKEQNLSDLSNPSEALKSLGLDSEGAGYKAIVDAIFYVGIIISGEQSPATRFLGRHGLT
jgi:hypothetical protein